MTGSAVGTVTYRFDWSLDPAFPAVPSTGTVSGIPQGSGGDTAFEVPVPPGLIVNTTYFWRAQASAGPITSAYSTVSTFKTPALTPFIEALILSSPRVEADLSVQVTANVVDRLTAGAVTYEWSVSPARGSFSGSGPSVTWTSPHAAPSPADYTITLNVTETFPGADGQTTQVKGAPRSVVVHYNDSYKDIDRKTSRYLTQLFPNFSLAASQIMGDFSDRCPGKAQEQRDVETNRANYRILSGTFSGNVKLDPGLTVGNDIGPCVFRDIPTNPALPNFGKEETVSGICTMKAIYENGDWFLCESLFKGQSVTSPILAGRVPGGSAADAAAASSPR